MKKFVSFCKKYRIIIFWIAVASFVLPEVTVYFQRSARGGDINGYISAGQNALQLGDLYKDSAPGKNNTWPPFFSFFAVPLALSEKYIGLPLTKEWWYFVNFICLIAAMKIWIMLLYTRKPSFIPNGKFDFTSDLVFVPFLMILPAMVYNFFMLQINVFILFLLSAGFYLHTKDKKAASGLLFGLAGAIKAYPGIFAIYFLLRKQWKTAFSTIVSGILFTLSPIIFYGVDRYLKLMESWLSLSFGKPFIVGYIRHNNQSLYAFWERLLAHQLSITQPASVLIKAMTYSSILAIFATIVIIICRRRYRAGSFDSLIEIAIFCIMMIIFAPIAWIHYWVLLFPASAIIYFSIRTRPAIFKGSFKYLFITSILLMQIPYITDKTQIADFLKAYSAYTIAAVLMIV